MRSIIIYDERFEGGPVFVGEHKNVPHDWTGDLILERFGIAKHLSVYEIVTDVGPKNTRIIQHGDSYCKSRSDAPYNPQID